MIDRKCPRSAVILALANSGAMLGNVSIGDVADKVIDAYEAAKLAALPANTVERVAHALYRQEWQHAKNPPSWESQSAIEREYWFGVARAAIAAMPEPQEVSEEELERSIRDACTDPHPYGSNCSISGRDARRTAKYLLAGYRIVKGEA